MSSRMPDAAVTVSPVRARAVLYLSGFASSDKSTKAGYFAERLRERMGNVTVRVLQVDKLERTATGKLRAVISLITPSDVNQG